MSYMMITTPNGEYRVRWRKAGFSFAIAVVYARRPVFGRFFIWRKVWDRSTARYRLEAERMLPKDMREWFLEACLDFERYESAWAGEQQR